MAEALDAQERLAPKPEDQPKQGKLSLENMEVPPRPTNDAMTVQRFGDLTLRDDKKTGEDKPKESSKEGSDGLDLKTKKEIVSALRSLFSASSILGDTNDDGILTKEELGKIGVQNEPYKSQVNTLIKNFDKVAPDGSLSEEQARAKIREFNKDIRKAEAPDREKQDKEIAQRAEKLVQQGEAALKFAKEKGQEPVKAISEALRSNNVAFLASPAGSMLQDIFKNAPAGSRLAMTEFPSSLRPLFDKFNQSPKGSDFSIPEKLPAEMGGQAVLDELKEIWTPQVNEIMKGLHDAGVSVVPVGDSRLIPYGAIGDPGTEREQAREQQIKDNILAVWSEDKSKPVLALGVRLHGARAYEGTDKFKSASYLLTNDATFKAGGGKVVSFDTAVFNPDNMQDGPMNPGTIAKKIDKSTCVPTRIKDQATAAGALHFGDNEAYYQGLGAYNEDAFDYLILHP